MEKWRYSGGDLSNVGIDGGLDGASESSDCSVSVGEIGWSRVYDRHDIYHPDDIPQYIAISSVSSG